uniref:Transglutaminase-like domain-containing protein n=1 Tax=Janibacter limosus TaxID=53458 RepID=A0AC61U4A7_9MICO|nr:transglutaminase-like domain-containing protein [Janibacter limosus]
MSVPDDGYRSPRILTTGRVEGIEFLGSAQERLQDEARLNLSTNTVLVPPGIGPGDVYEVRTELPPTGAGALPEQLPVAAGSMPISGDAAFVDGRIRAWKGDASDRWGQFRAIAATMREEGTYTDGTPATSDTALDAERSGRARAALLHPAGHGRGRLDDFLNSDPLAGDDEQYAATLALIGNRPGIPTRVVVGATATDDGVVRGRDIHAWVEVQQTDGQWFRVLPQTFIPDATEQATPGRHRADPVDGARGHPSTAAATAAAGTARAGRRLVLPVGPAAVGTAPRRLRGCTAAPPPADARRHRRPSSRPAAARQPDRRVGRARNDLVEEAGVLGRRLPAGATRVEQARALGPGTGAVPAAMRADGLIFGEAPPRAAEISARQAELRRVRRRMRRETPFVTRLRATFDPRPLFSHHEDIGLHDTTTAPSRKALR